MAEDAMKNAAPFEYCAIRYLELYVTTDKALLASFGNGPTVDDVLTLLSKYGVSRSFGKISIDENARFICNALSREANSTRAGHEKVVALAAALEKRFKKNTVSAASKLLWATDPNGIVIYDSRAHASLARTALHLGPRDYVAYVAEWNKGYHAAKAAIALAVKALSKLPREFTAAHAMPKNQFARTLGSEAFRRRVYDQFLWLNG